MWIGIETCKYCDELRYTLTALSDISVVHKTIGLSFGVEANPFWHYWPDSCCLRTVTWRSAQCSHCHRRRQKKIRTQIDHFTHKPFLINICLPRVQVRGASRYWNARQVLLLIAECWKWKSKRKMRKENMGAARGRHTTHLHHLPSILIANKAFPTESSNRTPTVICDTATIS